MQIGALAKKSGVSRDAIRFYEKMGLIHSQRQDNGYRSYAPVEQELIGFIKSAQEMGLTLAEIQRILPLVRDADGVPTELVQLFVTERIAQIDARMASLQALKDRLTGLLGGAACPIRLACEAALGNDVVSSV